MFGENYTKSICTNKQCVVEKLRFAYDFSRPSVPSPSSHMPSSNTDNVENVSLYTSMLNYNTLKIRPNLMHTDTKIANKCKRTITYFNHNVKLLIGIPSDHRKIKLRDKMRQTWLKDPLLDAHVAACFLLSAHARTVSKREHKMNDILFIQAQETRFILQKCNQVFCIQKFWEGYAHVQTICVLRGSLKNDQYTVHRKSR